jgi:ATP-dependent DNA helicase RecQ
MEEAENQVLSPEAEQLFASLRDWRRKLATEKSVPPYIIAHDRTLKAVALARPANEKELLKVDGFGPKKVETYGVEILRIIKEKGNV